MASDIVGDVRVADVGGSGGVVRLEGERGPIDVRVSAEPDGVPVVSQATPSRKHKGALSWTSVLPLVPRPG